MSSNAEEEAIHNTIVALCPIRVFLKGNIETNRNLPPSHKSCNILCTSLDLYASVIHCKSSSLKSRSGDLAGEHREKKGRPSPAAWSTSVAGQKITKAKCLCIVQYSSNWTRRVGARK